MTFRLFFEIIFAVFGLLVFLYMASYFITSAFLAARKNFKIKHGD